MTPGSARSPLAAVAETGHLHSMPPVDEDILRRALAAPHGPPRGDSDLDPTIGRHGGALTPAAVLCPIVRREAGLAVILTTRPATMRAHPGQIAFPGGKVDPGDANPLAAALRETREEIGLPESQVRVLGELERYETRTGFAVSPFVGLVAEGFEPVPEPGEVEDIFETPLDFLMDMANHRRMSREWKGARRWFWAMPWGDRFIWGATAGMIRTLAERVAAMRAPAP
jgi:8-oxo-dGTP pyrophosphatase MutT (NUDIX family)